MKNPKTLNREFFVVLDIFEIKLLNFDIRQRKEVTKSVILNYKGGHTMTKKVYQLETIGCPSCIAKIEGALKKLKGIHQSEVLFNSSRVKVEYDDTRITSNEIVSSVEKLGYKVLGENKHGS